MQALLNSSNFGILLFSGRSKGWIVSVMGKTTYCDTWVGEFPWVKSVKGDVTSALCIIWKKKIRIDGSGLSQVGSHEWSMSSLKRLWKDSQVRVISWHLEKVPSLLKVTLYWQNCKRWTHSEGPNYPSIKSCRFQLLLCKHKGWCRALQIHVPWFWHCEEL